MNNALSVSGECSILDQVFGEFIFGEYSSNKLLGLIGSGRVGSVKSSLES